MKRIFISLYLTALPVVIGIGGWRLAGSEPGAMAWMVSALVPLLFVGGLMIAKRARTAEQPIVIHLAGPIGIGAAALLAPLEAARVPLMVAGALWAAHLIYLFGYSRFGREKSSRIEVGSEMPNVVFSDIDGQPVSTADLRGAPAVLLFFRGNWCPLCMAQIREVAASYRAKGL